MEYDETEDSYENPAPAGYRKRPGVDPEGGCGDPFCTDCYEPIPVTIPRVRVLLDGKPIFEPKDRRPLMAVPGMYEHSLANPMPEAEAVPRPTAPSLYRIESQSFDWGRWRLVTARPHGERYPFNPVTRVLEFTAREEAEDAATALGRSNAASYRVVDDGGEPVFEPGATAPSQLTEAPSTAPFPLEITVAVTNGSATDPKRRELGTFASFGAARRAVGQWVAEGQSLDEPPNRPRLHK